MSKTVGIIGGMGPEATLDFMSRIMKNTPATEDQDHIRMIIENNPQIPSRQNAIEGTGDDPGAKIALIAARLEDAGVDFLVMPCNLAHVWQKEIESAVRIPFVSIVDQLVHAVLTVNKGKGNIGLMTTPGCYRAGIYQEALAKSGKNLILQTPDELSETMIFVERIKSGDKSQEVRIGLQGLANKIIDRGAEILIAACTEFPLVLNKSMFTVPFISSTEVLAEKTVAIALEDY
tara:strand:+ start:12793 stop:13491 length:699 start_codon:yes stop_codon:yes gene_type:complete